jgi:transcription elongation GreA/GreB family factor
MMSPLAVAQYIPKGTVEFDLVIIDEASQMTPENAIGALVRSKQAMIVGDTNQLPPTNFFRKVYDDYEDEEAVNDESVLQLANTVFRPARRLRWHYRSRHSSLIAFSNKYVYNNDLIVFPNVNSISAQMGVSLVEVEGLYSSGTNPIEAAVMSNAIITFMKTNPGRSLGVVVLNQRQRDLLAQEFEHTLRLEPKCVLYIERWEKDINEGLESFFIKNLENVQGDERDVIFIGTVYGPETRGGKVHQRFGPINGITGKRRLNVLFTRAKEQIVTFSSMTSADILAQQGGNEGVFLLKRWLEYSATGHLETGEETYKEPDSDFECYVIDALKSMGCEPVSQVGVAGYFIDIGVKHAHWPHGYVLGIECDGRTYHSSKSARDRDRLRQEVLQNLGWHFHRIWSTDWLENPKDEITKLKEVITNRLKELQEKKPDSYIFEPPSRQNEQLELQEKPSEYDVTEDADDLEEKEEEYATFAEEPIIDDDDDDFVEVGDAVTYYYDEELDDLKEITISARKNDPNNRVLLYSKPLAQALIEAEIDQQVVISEDLGSRTVTVVGIRKKNGKSFGDCLIV